MLLFSHVVISRQVHWHVQHKPSGDPRICYPEASATVTPQQHSDSQRPLGQEQRMGMKWCSVYVLVGGFMCVSVCVKGDRRGQRKPVKGIRPPDWWKEWPTDHIKGSYQGPMLLCWCTGQSKHWERVAKPALTDIKDRGSILTVQLNNPRICYALSHTLTPFIGFSWMVQWWCFCLFGYLQC